MDMINAITLLDDVLSERADGWILLYTEIDDDNAQVKIHGGGPRVLNIGLLESAKHILLRDVIYETTSGEEGEENSYG